MASSGPTNNQTSIQSESLVSQKPNANHVSMETRCVSEENDRNSNVSPSKTSDPARKKTFKIISVKKGGTGSGDLVTDNDADSVDGLDESQTEDLSSEFYDSSKATDLDVDVQDTPLTPDEVTSTTTIVMKQKPDQNSQSRFKVVKIETKEPFRRGKWVCYDFFDTAPAAVVTLNGSKATEDSIIQSALSGTLSSSTSVHYVHEGNESSSNLFVAPVVPLSPSSVPGQPILTDMFFPIQPAPASQVQSNMDGSPNVITQYPQPVHMSVAGGPPSSSSFHTIAQSGGTTIVQSLPHTNVFPYAQNGPSSTFLNGSSVEKASQPILPNSSLAAASGSGQSMPPSMVTISSLTGDPSGTIGPGQSFTVTSPGSAVTPQTPIQQQPPHGAVASEVGVGMILDENQVRTGGGVPMIGAVGQMPAGISMVNTEDSKPEFTSLADQMGPGMDESMSSVKTLEPGDAQDPAKLEEAVETMYMDLEGNEEDQDDER
ncbi:hypothetical protein PoB_001570700 [Plakobranchus ocellatus]|uniref:Uncharacterized protein n=1 Tax=Plakobranchus ocellatus TaxID=259542 RepID=A0AAV3Z3R8_9GAST|nr:hypothetical protein PoB_001570700 [Plakobranchus ocellatus]